MKCVMGMVRPRALGQSRLDGKPHDLTRLSTEEIVNPGVAMVPEGRRLFPGLSVRRTSCSALSASGAPRHRQEPWPFRSRFFPSCGAQAPARRLVSPAASSRWLAIAAR